MARIGLKGLTYAKVTGGGAGSAVTYSGGKSVPDMMVRANVTYNRNSVKQHADDHAVESDNSINGGSIELGLADLGDDQVTDLLGYTVTNGEIVYTGEESPYMGVGWITCRVRHGVKKFVGHWHYKVQFGLNSENNETKAENTAFQDDTLNGDMLGVVQSESGKVDYKATFSAATEAAVRSWLNNKAGVSTSGT